MRDELQADDQSSELTDDSSVATLEPAIDLDPADVESAGPKCEKCAAPLNVGMVTICRRCGWYANLGTFVEIDKNWDNDTDDAEQATHAAPQKSHIRVWLDLMPRWSWVIIASVMVVVVESVVIRLVTSDDGGLRTTWSLAQLALGVIAVSACHVFNFVVLAAEDADFGVLDLFLKPLKLWIRAVNYLPTRLWVANTAACGLAAAALSMLVIGGIPYERMWDWGFQQPVKQELMSAVMDRAKKLDSRNDGDLEEAIGDFAGSQDGLTGADGKKIDAPMPRIKADCVILGYNVDREGRLESLVLGVAHGRKLIHAGRVKPEMGDEELGALLMELTSVKTLQPFITVEAEATWVKPKFTCRVTYGERLKGGQLRDVKWESLLGSMRSK